MPEPEQFADFVFPNFGMEVVTEYELQREGTSPLMVNVRVFESLTSRARGGSRPGLSKFIPHDLSDPQPVQMLAILVTPGGANGSEWAGLNADQPATEGGWPTNPITDPSSNNQVLGAGIIRNMKVESGAIVARVLRDGGSGRPQFRVTGALTCTARTYRVLNEATYLFTVRSSDLPESILAIMQAVGINWSANNAAYWTLTTLLDTAGMNSLASGDSGWVATGAQFLDFSDAPC
jgi:hypothetical protein